MSDRQSARWGTSRWDALRWAGSATPTPTPTPTSGTSVVTGLVQSMVALTDRLTRGLITPHAVPIEIDDLTNYGNGTGPKQVQRVYGGWFTLAGAPQSIDLTTVQCSDGSVGLSHVRELVIFNPDGNVAHTVNFGDDSIEINLFLGGLMGTHPQYTIQPGGTYRDAHPLGSTGYTVDSTHKNLHLDPGANTVTIAMMVAGD